MYSKYILSALLCSATILGITACGDDVITIDKNEIYSVVDDLDSIPCTKENEGNLSFSKKDNKMYSCADGEWVAMSDQEAIKFRCKSEELEDKAGFAIICDGSDTIGVIYNGKNGQNGVSIDTAAIKKTVNDALSEASAKNQSEIEEALKYLSSASAMNQKDIEDALKGLSSASAKSQKDVEDALKNLSSATDKFGEEINNKFNDAYNSWNAELEDRSCAIVDTVRDNEKAIITVTIRCGEAETKMEIPFTRTSPRCTRSMLSCVSRFRRLRKQNPKTSTKKSGRTSRVAIMPNLR